MGAPPVRIPAASQPETGLPVVGIAARPLLKGGALASWEAGVNNAAHNRLAVRPSRRLATPPGDRANWFRTERDSAH